MRIDLEIETGEGSTKLRFDETTIVIGRSRSGRDRSKQGHPLVNLRTDTRVSREHARLNYEMSTWYVEDLGSQNGTQLGDDDLSENTRYELSPGDRLRVGNARIRVHFEAREEDVEAGDIDREQIVHETRPPESVDESKHVQVLSKISQISSHVRGREAMLQAYIHMLEDLLPGATGRTILLVEERELVARAMWPLQSARASWTLARRAIDQRAGFVWKRSEDQGALPSLAAPGLGDVREAMYAPMLSTGTGVGVLHVDTDLEDRAFSDTDLALLTVVANTIAPVLDPARGGLPDLPSVFLSYAHADRERVQRLASDLRRRQVRVWYDEHLQTGDEWREMLRESIASTRFFVLALTAKAWSSEFVRWELEQAREHDKLILPVLLSGFEDEPPEELAETQFLDLRDAEDGIAVSRLASRIHDLSPER